MDNTSQDTATLRVQFTGRGWEYFGIWLANVALSVITFGIYSPWAKVRRLKYFYRNTTLASSPFDFHGDPVKILFGRLIAIVFFSVYSALSNLEPPYAFIPPLFALIFSPFLIQRALKFRLRYSSYRGLNFNFTGSVKGALLNAVLYPGLSFIIFGLLYPFGFRQWRRYQLRNSAFGKTNFDYDAKIGGFYLMFFFGWLPLVATAIVSIVLFTLFAQQASSDNKIPFDQLPLTVQYIIIAFAVILPCSFFLSRGLYQYFKHRLTYNNLKIGHYSFRSTIRIFPCILTYLSNDIFSILTLGLFRPFAAVRATRLLATNVEVTGPAALDSFVGDNLTAVSTTGAEAVDFFDIDIGF